MKFLAVAAALVATVAAAPKENWGGWGNRGLGGWGNGGWGNGGWGGWDNGYWGLGRTVSNQEASNVCGSGNTVMCCNSFTHRNNLDSGNGVGNALDRMPGGFGPGAGSYSQCNDINILCE